MTRAPKPRPCKHCASIFTPQRMGQRVCDRICAEEYARAVNAKEAKKAAKVERAQDRKRLEEMKSAKELIPGVQEAFNRWVRERDAAQPCISCGKPAQSVYDYQGGRDAGHYRSVAAASHLRFHEDNCHSQCVKCNQFKAGNAVDYRLGLLSRLGTVRVEALESNNTVHKWTRDELIALKKHYVAALKALKTNQGEQE